ncbi:hypothetical protein EUTSA_v100029340mg, partial [Eutrema salsugineum]
FPPSSDFTKDNIAHSPKILTRAINSSGPDQLSQGEKVLNWQTENAIAQNQLLKTINYKVDQLTENYIKRQTSLQSSITEIHGRLNNLHQEMMAMAQNMMVNTAQFRHKEAETASLKAQLKDLQRSLESMIYNQNPASSYPFGGMPTYQGTYSPGFLSGYTNQRPRTPAPGFLSSDEAFTSRYGMSSASKPKASKSKPRRQKDSEFMVNPTKRPTLTSSSSHESVEDSKGKGKEIGIIEFSMASLLDTIGQTSTSQTATEMPHTQPSQIATPIANIGHYSETNSNSSESTSDEESLPNQFAIGDERGETSAPKRVPDIHEIYSSDEDM